jgi:hypothetical protein
VLTPPTRAPPRCRLTAHPSLSALIGVLLSETLLKDNLCSTPAAVNRGWISRGQRRRDWSLTVTGACTRVCRPMAQPASSPKGSLGRRVAEAVTGGTLRRATGGPRQLIEAIVLVLVFAH